jgi:hypothetical protein
MSTHRARPWSLPKEPDTPEAKAIQQIQHLLQKEQAGGLIGLWELNSGYSNIRVYVVQAEGGADPFSYLVVQYGMDYHILRRDQVLSALLELDGFDMVVEYREQVLGISIDPTEEEVQAFILRYRHGVEQWIAECMTCAEFPHPWHLTDLKIVEGIFATFSPEEQQQHRRSHRYIWNTWAGRTSWGSPPYPEIEALKEVNKLARERLYSWWKRACADYDFPPAPVPTEADKKELPTLLYKGETYKKVSVVGQVAIIPVLSPFFSRTEPGFDLVEQRSARKIATWLPTYPGGKKAACHLAELLSALLNWQEFEALSPRQKRGVGVRVHELQCEMMALYANPENTPA